MKAALDVAYEEGFGYAATVAFQDWSDAEVILEEMVAASRGRSDVYKNHARPQSNPDVAPACALAGGNRKEDAEDQVLRFAVKLRMSGRFNRWFMRNVDSITLSVANYPIVVEVSGAPR
jgi:hypothetical protein